jgi:nucleotide sugar dehydrogenase
MATYLNESLLTGELSRIADGKAKPEWSVSVREYYDLTPPTEQTDDLHRLDQDASLLPPIDIDSETDTLVAVIGVGYVGEHLVNTSCKRHHVLGYDLSESRLKTLQGKFKDMDTVRFTSEAAELAAATHFLIAVPTLLLPDNSIDSSYLRYALSTVSAYARRGSVVVIESSVAVGMTRQLLGPLAKDHGLLAGMSPERVDPGRTSPPSPAIPKIVSGLDDITPGSSAAIKRLYISAFDQVVPVSRPEVAEMMKLYENCQRMMCIAYANEMADACVSHGIDPFEVCAAASTKPFGYMPFAPGLGVGGHCIPVNPWYLLSNSSFPMLKAASEAMRDRPSVLARRIVEQLSRGCEGERSAGNLHPRVLVVGVGFKAGQSHLANSPGLELAKSLSLTGKVHVSWADPLVAQEAVPQITRLPVEDWTAETLDRDFDLVVVAFRQHGLDFGVLRCLRRAVVQMWCS